MIEQQRVLALIPARGGSKGLPGKNLAEIEGIPLVGWPIQAALESSFVDQVVVSTDDGAIAAAARALGAEVPFTRPEELATDTATSSQVVFHALDFYAGLGRTFDYIVLLEPTSPLTQARDIDSALASLHEHRDAADAIVGVARIESTHPAFALARNRDGLLHPHFADSFETLGRRQDLVELYFPEGTLYISDVEAFRRTETFYHERTMGYVVPKWKSIEVDDLSDLICARAIMQNRERLEKEGRDEG